MLIINWPGCISSWVSMKAVDKYEKLQAQNEGNTALYRAIGDCYSRMEQYPSATIAYFQAYNLNRENAGLAGALVNTLYRMGVGSPDYILEGVAICDTALIYNPGIANYYAVKLWVCIWQNNSLRLIPFTLVCWLMVILLTLP